MTSWRSPETFWKVPSTMSTTTSNIPDPAGHAETECTRIESPAGYDETRKTTTTRKQTPPEPAQDRSLQRREASASGERQHRTVSRGLMESREGPQEGAPSAHLEVSRRPVVSTGVVAMALTQPLAPIPPPAERPTLDIPEAGAYLGLSRIASYRAAKDGYLPVIQISERRFKVPTAALREMLGLPA